MLYRYLLFACTIRTVLSAQKEVVVLRAARGRDAWLPCGPGSIFLDGPDAYVLWLKEDRDFLYRYPNEESERRDVHQDRMFATPCGSDMCHDKTSLLLKDVTDQNAGRYSCIVHYQGSSSVEYISDVRLVDSPGMPRIYKNGGEEIKKGYVGPLSLGSNLTLTCEVTDDQPETSVFWRRNGLVVERAIAVRPGVLRAEVHLQNISRAELNTHYECVAQNADVTEPLTTGVVVKMYMAPLSVEIRLNNYYEFEAGQPRVVDCVVVGCMPSPTVTWHLGNTVLRSRSHKELHDGNYTVSSLTLTPSLRESGRELVCTAHNSHLPNAVFEDRVTINVGYRPTCVKTREEMIGAVTREAESVTCFVEASPEPIQFAWTFADFKTLYTGVTKVPGYSNRYSSTLTWLSREGDIGRLLCRALNTFGEQKKPCVYTISPGGPPLVPDCVILRSFPKILRVQCKKAWDGGRQQTIHLEILDEDGYLVHNVSDAAGLFNLPDVSKGRNWTAVVYASSVRGRSEKSTMYLQSIMPLNAEEMERNPAPRWFRWLEIVGGTLAGLVGLAMIAIFVRAFKSTSENPDLNPDLVPRSDGSFHREPDFARDDRLLGTTNITVNQMASCQNKYTSAPLPGCRVLVGCGTYSPTQDPCLASQHSYFV